MICSRAEILVMVGLANSNLTEKILSCLNILHPMAERAVKDLLDNDIEQATHVEFLPANDRGQQVDPLLDSDIAVRANSFSFRAAGRSTDVLQLKHTPIVLDGLEVREESDAMAGQRDGAWGSNTILTRGVDYFLDLDETGMSRTGHLCRQGLWSGEPRSVKVTYLGGYTRQQLDSGIALGIKEAVLITAAVNLKEAIIQWNLTGGPLVSESLGHYSATYAAVGMENFSWSVNVPAKAVDKLQKYRNYGRLFA